MKSFLLDNKGDLVMKNGTFVIVEGNEELKQQIRMSLLTSKGEWFLDVEEGMDREPIFSKFFNEVEARDSIIESLSNLSETVLVEEINFIRDMQKREMQVLLSLRKENEEAFKLEVSI